MVLVVSSAPTANRRELFLVVVSMAEAVLAVAVAPIAPEPLLPVASAPIKLTTVSDMSTLEPGMFLTSAVIETLVRTEGAKARQTSAVPP